MATPDHTKQIHQELEPRVHPDTATDAAAETETQDAGVPHVEMPAPPFRPEHLVPHAAPMPTVQQLAVALGMLVLVFGVSYIPGLTDRNMPQNSEGPAATPSVIEHEETAEDPFTEVAITAKAAYVWDVKNQRALYNKSAGEQLPLASLTKLMTALVAYEYLTPEDRIRIPVEAILQDGDSNLSYGEAFSLRDLADLTLVTSSNDGAYALAAAAGAALAPQQDPTATFVEAMNIRAEAIGLSQSYFTNPTGLDTNADTSGSYGSARDMAFLMEYLILHHPDIIEITKRQSSTIYDQQGTVFTATNTNEIAAEIPGLIGSKTGYTDLAGGNLVVAFDAGLNRPIIVSVLGSTRESRFTDVLTLVARARTAVLNETAYGN